MIENEVKVYISKMKMLSILIICTLILCACTPVATTNTDGTSTAAVKYIKISASEAKEIIDSEEVVILDVRTQAEFDEGHIENATLLPDTEIEKKAEITLNDKDEKILVYCRSGKRSAASSKKLIEMGYTNVIDFGGINDWNYKVVQ